MFLAKKYKEEDMAKAISEIVRKVKTESIQYQITHLKDISKLQMLMKQREEVPGWNISGIFGEN